MITFLLIWLAAQAVSVGFVWQFTVKLGRPERLAASPPVAVMVAVKGHEHELDGFLTSLFAQDYPAYRVIFAVEAASDAAVPAIEVFRTRFPDRVSLVVAGLGRDEGQKSTNLRAAAAQLTAADEIVVLADADIWPEPDWLTRLIAPLVRKEADVVSGFSWLIVKDRKLSTFVLASMAASVATLPRYSFFNACWGGSTALTRERFAALGFPDAWRGTLSDDLQLTNAVQHAGLTIAAPREILLRTPLLTRGFADIAAGTRRWYMLVRMHMPAAYFITVAAMSFVAAGWLFTLVGAVVDNVDAENILVAALALSIFRSAGRAMLVARLWGSAGIDENRAFLLADPFVTPLAACANAAFGWSALTTRQTTWAGITYEMRGPQQVRIVARAGS
jgi:Glycosyl transferase family 21